VIIIVMGVTGAGKTTVGSLLAERLGWEFADADVFHPPANVEKMSRGDPLDDADRGPWLESLHTAIVSWIQEHRNVVLACSALKQSYREYLCIGSEVKLVYLKGTYKLVYERLRSRHGHFATGEILAGQFRDLEEPKAAIMVDTTEAPSTIVEEVLSRLGPDINRLGSASCKQHSL
jgi:gluconokinase